MLLTNLSFQGIDQTNFQPCSIRSIIQEALERYPFEENQKELIHWSDQQDFEINGSSLLIMHVLFNLIKNALYFIQATEKGHIIIWFSSSSTNHELHFKDTSKGIAANILPYIFDRFFTSQTRHGSGIGLAFSKMCLQAHGGDIVCYSQEGEYTEFILSFPSIPIK